MADDEGPHEPPLEPPHEPPLDLPLEQIVHSPTMRPFTVANKGKPAMSLFT